MKPRLLDLFCGAGGCSVGYHRAGFEVVGVDIVPQPHYPFEFHQADALEYCAEHWQEFDAIHASPPCQGYSRLKSMHPQKSDAYPRLIPATRELLAKTGRPFVIENVEGSDLSGVILCGSMFGLRIERGWLRRHRKFESSFFMLQPSCQHPSGEMAVGVYGHGGHSGKRRMLYRREAAEILQIDWMNQSELSQAIPPAYTEWIGRQLLGYLGVSDDD